MNLRAGVPMSLVCEVRLAGILFLGLICISCGDTYRPTIIPNPVRPPDPMNFHAVIAVNQNSAFYPGTGMQMDVSGDSNSGVTKVEMVPVHAALLNGRVWVANSGSNSVSVFSPAIAGGTIGSSTDVNLPPGFTPVFLHSTETGTMYVANAASPDANAGPGTVNVITTSGNVVSFVIPVGRNPVAMAETPNPNLPFNRELYVVNQGDNNVSHIHALDKSVVGTIPVGATPSLAYARSDNQKIFVFNQGSGTITTINTLDDSVAGTVGADAGANFMIYDSHLNRLYVTSSTGSLFVYDAAAASAVLMKQIAIPGAGDCAQCVPASVAALPDGTHVYVGSAFETTDSSKCVQVVGALPVNCYLTQVTVIDAASLTARTGTATAPNPFPVPTPTATVLAGAPVLAQAGCATTRFRLSLAAAADSSRVFLAACDAGGVSTINTSNDTYVVTLPTPVSAFPPIQTDPNIPPQPPRQNPVFLLTGQ
jgi:YVTN family beta-propeller protein